MIDWKASEAEKNQQLMSMFEVGLDIAQIKSVIRLQ